MSQNGTTCNDGDSCTQNDTCQSGIRVPGTTIPCATPPGECYEAQGVCDQAGCHYVPKQVGTACASDGNACTSDACDGAGACAHTVEAGLDCNDGDACTTGTTCSAIGTCNGGTQVTCTTPPETGCYEATTRATRARCVYAPLPYNTPCASDGNACTRDVCNAGACTHPANAGATCDDGDACTTGERCSSSATCGSGTAVLCPSTDCKAGTCNSATGCYQVNVANGTVCTTDANECTSDVCQSGVCEHLSGPLDGQACTPDANTCTTYRCSAGNCTHTAQSSCNGGCPCPAGQTCCGTSCVALSTDEGNCGACGNTWTSSWAAYSNACWVSDCNAGVCSACRWTNDC